MMRQPFSRAPSFLATGALALALVALPDPIAAQDEDPNQLYDPALYEGLEYRNVGPMRGGRSTAVTGHPSDPHTFFMGTTGGGVWKTEDAGHSWTNISDDHFDVAPVGAVVVAPSDPNVLYVGTGSACIRGNTSIGEGVYRSTDGGKTWEFIGLPEAGQIGDIQVHPTNPELVYVAAVGNPFGINAQRGVFRSNDGGDTWEKVLFISDGTGVVDLSLNPKNPREIYAAAWRAQRKPWTMVSGAEEGGIFKSTDSGDSWERLEGGLPTGVVGKAAVSVSPADPDRVWAIIEAEPDGGVYRSDDGGESWTRVNDENKLRQRAWYYTHINADPQDPNTVYALNTDLYRSVDGGRTFEEIDVPHGDVHDLWINPEQPHIMGVADDGGAQVTLTNGEGWSTYYNQPTAEMYDVTVDNQIPYRLYSGQQDNSAISVPAWTPGGTLHYAATWENGAGCETGPVALHPDHPETIYGGCYGGDINRMDTKTNVGRNVLLYPQLQLGQRMTDMKHRFQWVSPIVVSPHDPNVVYHASQYVNRTTDGGMTWETISPDLTTNNPEHQGFAGEPINPDVTGVEVYNTVFALTVSPHAPDVLWAGSDDGLIHITRDGGANWTEITPDGLPELATVDEIHVSEHRTGVAYVAAHKYRLDDFRPYIFKTENHGEDWELLTTGENGIPDGHFVRTVREDPERPGLLFAGTERGVYVSFDDGEHWQTLQNNLPVVPVTGMKVHRGDLVIATQGRGFWIMDDISPLRQLTGTVASADAYLFNSRTAYRMNDYTRPNGALINYWLAEEREGPLTVEVLDDAGRVVRTYTSDEERADEPGVGSISADAGHHRFSWNLTYPGPDQPDDVVLWAFTGGVPAPPGDYRVRLTVGDDVQTRRLRVEGDPRFNVPQADFEEQAQLAAAVRDTLDAVWNALRAARSVKEQTASIEERLDDAGRADPTITARADSLAAKLTAVETEITQVRSESGQDPIRFPGQIDNQYATLYGHIAGPEGRPNEGSYIRFDDLNLEWAELRAEFERILETDVPAFNQLLRDLGIPAVILPPDEAAAETVTDGAGSGR